MTLREVYENVLIELNKVLAPPILLLDFNYLLNKEILLYFNKRYNAFEINQQLTDDLRVLTKTELLTEITDTNNRPVFGTSHKFNLPSDYVHILNCICVFKLTDTRCGKCQTIEIGADKLDTNLWSSIITNYYMRPSPKKPYYYIINIDEPTPETIQSRRYTMEDNLHGELDGNRGGNSVIPTLEIKCGDLKAGESLLAVYIDYLRAPKYIDLIVDDLDEVEDNTPHLEFPDYVIYEIIKELVTSIMENALNPRIQSFIPVNAAIPSSTEQSQS